MTRLQAVITQPDRPAGRGQKLKSSAVKNAAAQLNAPVYEPPALKPFAAEHQGEAYDLFIVASYGRILPPALLALPRSGALNIHPSLLPKYRGATPIQAALRNGDAQTGVSIMLMDSGMDTGPLLLQEAVRIGRDENYGALHDRLAQLGATLLSRALEVAARGELHPHPQMGEASVTRPLSKDELQIDWTSSAAQIVDTIRALSPEPAARADIGGVHVKILRAKEFQGAQTGARTGEFFERDDALLVACEDGAVEIEEVIPANRGRMSGQNFSALLKRVR